MSGRCRSCDDVLTEDELTNKWAGSEEYCDLCSYCLRASDPDYDYDPSVDDFEDDDDD